MRRRGDYDPNTGLNRLGADPNYERGARGHQGLLVTDSSGAPQMLMISRNAPPGGLLDGGSRLAMSSSMLGRRRLDGLLGGATSTGGENDPWATFWASMLASIIVSTDEELAQSLITMFGSDGPPEPPPPETLTAAQFDSLEQVEFVTSPAAARETPLGKGGRPRVAEPDSCPICMCEYADGMCLTRLPCSTNHVFHEDCLRTWLLNKSTNCPMCRCDCRPKVTAEPDEEDLESLTADIDTAFNAVVEAADRVRDSMTEPVPVRANHNPRGRGLLRSSELESAAADSRPGSVSRLRRQVTVGRYAEHFLGDIEDEEAPLPATPASATPSSPTSAPTSPAESASDSELPEDIVEMEDRRLLAAARSRQAQGAARQAAADRAQSSMAAAQDALRARRQAGRELADVGGPGALDPEREMSDWYRNHRTSSLTRASEVAALIDAEAPAAARWSATSTPMPAVVHAESQTSTLPTLSRPGISVASVPGERRALPVPPRQLAALVDSRVLGEPADLSSAVDGMASSSAGRPASASLTQRWLARGRTVGGRSEVATAQIESAVSQLADARAQAAAARHSSAASSRRSAAALNESMRAAAAAEIPTRRTRSVSRGGASGASSSASVAPGAATRASASRGAGRMRRLMREARELENGGRRSGPGS